MSLAGTGEIATRHSNGIHAENRFLGLTRAELFMLVLATAMANALLPTIVVGITHDGLAYSLINTFEVSAIVWGGIALAFCYAARIEDGPISLADKAAAAAVVLACFLPLGPLTWVVLTGLAFYLILNSGDAASLQGRTGWIVLALSVPMFWSKRLFNMFSEFFLSLDAMLVSSITQTERVDNLVAMPGGAGVLQIAAPCSSMANLSLALLCWVLFTQYHAIRWQPRNILWCLAACLVVVCINVTRITLIGYFPHYYDVLHGPIGNTVASWLSIFAVVLVCLYGVRRGRVATV